MEDELGKAIQDWIDYQIDKQAELEKKYPPNPPNDVCENAYVKGMLIENSFNPQVGEMNELFVTEYEKLYVWTHDKDEYSAIVINVDSTVKDIPFWKNIGSVLWMAMQYANVFEGISSDWFEYRWIFYFDQEKSLSEQVFYNLDQFDEIYIKNGRVIKATDIGNLAPEIELMMRDDKAYTALMMLCNAFLQHYICLMCELSSHPYHNHLSEEPKIWEHAAIISNMEVAIVQACRSVEGILGEPPNSRKQAAVLKHKEKWIELTGINPDSIFEKANMSYLDFYYKLFFDLRNPSAHSYGNIHYDLEKSKTVQAQCFAAIIIRGYFHKHILALDEAQKKLNFNMNLLDRVSENVSTKLTK
ncbi:MAG: hypothetical protein MRZ63_00335 [Anaerostipes sp.]|nr:hypothetical protein [Anaerostipes sp.]